MNNNLNTTISEEDEMLSNDNVEHYMSVGYSALSIIKDALQSQKIEIIKVNTILDMPCGHGRVTRHLKSAFPNAEIIGCDINKDGVDFCEKNLNIKGVYSNIDFNKIQFDHSFDLIWVGSLITHFDVNQTKAFLNFITSYLNKGGICICTSHGTFVEQRIISVKYGLTDKSILKILKEYFQTGYGYADYEGQNGYGISLINKYWFYDFFKNSKFQIIKWYDHEWDNHHDVMVIGYC